MILQFIRTQRKRVLVDIGTQKDLFLSDGKACIRNHRHVLANVRRIMAWARHENMPVISTCQVCPNNNGGTALNYCLDGTEGQKKIRYTLINKRISFPADGSTDFPHDILRRYKQIILHKRSIDPFDEPRIDRLFSEIRANEFVLIGADAEGAVKAMALGLLQRNKKVTIIIDAVGSRNSDEAQIAFRKMNAKGAKLIETRKFAGSSHLKSVGICHCKICSSYARNTILKNSHN